MKILSGCSRWLVIGLAVCLVVPGQMPHRAIAQMPDVLSPQVPVVGDKVAYFYRMEFRDGVQSPDDPALIQRFTESCDQYFIAQSRGRLKIKWELSPVIPIDIDSSEIKKNDYRGVSNRTLQQAKTLFRRNYNEDNANFKFFSIPSQIGLGGAGGLGTGRGGKGTVWVSKIWVPGCIHEAFHALGVGHAEVVYDHESPEFKLRNGLGGTDPYHFMGSEGGGAKRVLPNGVHEIVAPIPLPMKYDLGWVDEDEVARVREPGEFLIFDHRKLPAKSKKKQFGVSIDTQAGSLFVSFDSEPIKFAHQGINTRDQLTPGLLVHLRPKKSPGVSRLLDFKPNSSDLLETSPNTRAALVEVHEFRDAAIPVGETMLIGNQLKITFVKQGMKKGIPWARVKVSF